MSDNTSINSGINSGIDSGINSAIETDEDSPSHSGLKAVVIILGILLIVGFVVLISMIFFSVANLGEDDPAAGAAPIVLQSGAPIELVLPAGAQIMETALDGNRVALRLALPGGGAKILIVDLVSGQTVREVIVTQGN